MGAINSRVGNTYQGNRLPDGVSSLEALSKDRSQSAAKKRSALTVPLPEPSVYDPVERGQFASSWLGELYANTAKDHPNIRTPSDRWSDKMLDKIGYFDPYSGNPNTLEQWRSYIVDEWYRRLSALNGRKY